MRVLLLFPPRVGIVRPSLPKSVEEEMQILPPLGILSIGTYLRKKTNHRVFCHDSLIEKAGFNEIRRLVKDLAPDIVGISAVTYMAYSVKRVSEIVKEINRNIHVCVGGPHLSLYPKETLLWKSVDSVVIGDGEFPFSEICDLLEGKKDINKIPGVYTKDGKKNDFQPHFEPDLDKLPIIDRTILPYKKYFSVFIDKPVTSLITSRGCPYRCIFCQLGKRKIQVRSIKNVIQEVKNCLNLGVKEIEIYDDTFNILPQRVIDFSKEILKEKMKFTWSFRGRVNAITPPLIKIAKKAGCVRILYGVESGSQKILNKLQKDITLKQIKNAFALTTKSKIETLAYFMVGSPGEGKEEIEETIKFAKEINPDYVTFSITTPWPGTQMYLDGLNIGLFKEDFWRNFAKNPKPNFSPRFWTKTLKKGEIFRLRRKALKDFYFRPKYILKRVLGVRSLLDLKIKLKAAMGLFTDIFKK